MASLRGLVIPFALAGTFHLLFRVNDAWRSPLIKILTFAAMAGLVVALSRRAPGGPMKGERWVYGTAAAALLVVWGVLYAPEIARAPQVDIGWTTRDAVRLVFLEQENPYQSATLNPHGTEPRFRGFHYGPGMFVGYWPAAIWPDAGIKIANVVYFLLLLAALWWIGDPGRTPDPAERAAAAAFAIALVVGLERIVWFELFTQGITDLFPVTLLVAALGCLRREWWMAAGACVGLSFAAKVAPACFLLLLLVRRTTPTRFYLGAAIGALPLLPFLVADAGALVNNTIVFHATKPPNDTSVLSMAPAGASVFFTLLLGGGAAALAILNFRRDVDLPALAAGLLALMTLAQAASREMHRNHIFWFVPLVAISMAWRRHAVSRFLVTHPASASSSSQSFKEPP